MEETGKVGIARFVMRSKQYLCAIRPKDGKLLLSTMVYADEVNSPAEIKEFEAVEAVDLSDRELNMAKQLVESLAAGFQPEQFQDTHREKVLELIERKAAGETGLVEVPQAPSEDKVVDLMAALEASVAAAKDARKRHPAAGPETEEKAKPEPAKKAARKRKAS
jgi:DNA end-binding protein Ku